MPSFLSGMFSSDNFIPHGFCLLWDPALLWLWMISDSAIAASYYTIPFALIYFIAKRRDLAFRGIFLLTSAFILACGTTHLMDVYTLWYPAYWLDGMVKFVTAAISAVTAVAMWRVMPVALALPSTAQLEDANRRLEREIAERRRAEAALRDANDELERRVADRTAALRAEVEQRRRTEETLRTSELRWRSIFEASAVGVAVTDESRRFVAVNDAFQQMLGYTADELCRLGPSDITFEGDRDITEEVLGEVISGRRAAHPVEKRYRRKDNAVIWVRVSTAQAPDPETGALGVSKIVEDITHQKLAADALQEARDTLLRVNRLSTVGELSASIAHEINQPLTAIVANGAACLRFLGADAPDIEEVRDAVHDIIGDGRRASEVLSRIRQLARKSPTEHAAIDLNGTISEVLSLARHELQRDGVTVEADLNSQLPPAMADRVQVQQVLLNLIMNGIEAMRRIGRAKVLRIKSEIAPPKEIAVTIEDSGGGFANENLEQIFDTFFTTKEDGMGMGLSISRSIVQTHGGRLWATAGTPFGAIFGFTLPAVVGEL
jgi:PAS domain S-box-containing protein